MRACGDVRYEVRGLGLPREGLRPEAVSCGQGRSSRVAPWGLAARYGQLRTGAWYKGHMQGETCNTCD